jgi:hypothetical protein
METLTGAGSAASVSVGQTATAYTDISGNAALTTISTAGKYGNLSLVNPGTVISANTAVVFKVNTAATYATANTAKVIIEGYYLSP